MLSSFVSMPWSFKILYGLISDNFPIFGSKRRSYCILLSVTQFAASITLSLYFGTNEQFASFLLMVNSGTVAAMDVIVDSIMVI